MTWELHGLRSRQALVPVLRLAILLCALMALGCASAGAGGEEILIDLNDPVGDDTGNGHYVYPLHPSFGAFGQADLTHFNMTVRGNQTIIKAKFRNLVDPWKVGNRLTYMAVGFDRAKVGIGELGHGGFALFEAKPEFVLFYGGGMARLEDMAGQPVSGVESCVVDMEANLVTIVVKSEALGVPTSGWKITIAAGLQDDYGQGGLGDFRMVNAQAAEWVGGGGHDLAINPNVYDVLLSPKTLRGGDDEKAKEIQARILGDYDLDTGKMVELPFIAIK